ncbi:Mediator complex subunit 25 von Willebrand factor type A [Nesidiocoris tenuis]|uniref:Mediator of RNA polymerase II transcription subunit 25 n=1 Tax=Nesidiocoris tenuis TaxID=355587 RepID=A0ABN7B5T1_9HEMI|nr:Mediator complex subunit 25 von Willebrand factor type A [Nesidiocoris tenuis]
MVVSNNDTSADVIFAIEGTAINGAYLGDIRTNYIVPALEFFNQGTLQDREYGCESTTGQYGIVIYHAADRLPCPSVDIYGPYSNPHRLLQTLDKIEMVGGGGESHANVAEGLAAALQCLDDLAQRRDTSAHCQKHCILICNSPPYLMPVMENQSYTGNTSEQMASILSEKGINLSILSPRKIPALYKLFEKSGGDLSACQTKNYAKDPRNLVLLKGFSLKERPVSPTTTAPPAAPPHMALGMPSPLQSHGSPMAPAPQPQPQQPVQPQQPIMTNVPPTPGMVVNAPPPNSMPQGRGYPPAYRPATQQPSRWPMMPPQGPRYADAQSALIAQLSRPPTAIPPQFNSPGGMVPSPGQQPQQQQVPNQQGPQQQAQPQQMSQGPQGPQGQQQPQPGQQQSNQMRMIGGQPGMGPQPGIGQQPGNVIPPSTQQGMIGQQQNVGVVMSQAGLINQNQQIAQGSVMQSQANQGPGMSQQQGPAPPKNREYRTIWQGLIEWIDKKSPSDSQKTTRHVPCQVSMGTKDGEPELKADTWPQKLIMQLMPKQLIGSIGGQYLKNSKSVLFHLQPSEALEALTKVMSNGFAGCVHFNSMASACDIKVLILLYTAERSAFLGFIPNDQAAFVDRLRRVIQHSKSTNAMNRQGQSGQGGQQMQPGAPQPNQQPGMSGMLQNSMNPQQGQQMANQMGVPVVSQQGGQMMGQMQQDQNQQQPAPGQPGSFQNPLVEARQENLVKIQRLRQTLEAAQQQELQYKNQLEVRTSMIMNQRMQHQQQSPMQDALGMHPGQSQDQFKQQLEMTLGYQQEQQKQLRAQLHQIQAQQQQQQVQQQVQQQQVQQQQVQQQQLRGMAPTAQPGPQQQRMLRPNISNNPGLRHLLQQPQYRINMQQQMPRGGMPNQPGQQPQNQNQFDEVGSYDFLGN